LKSTREIFKTNPSLLDKPEVAQLLEYCEQLQDEIVEFKFQKTNNKELAMLDMLKEVIKGCNAIEKEQAENERFGFEAPAYQETIANLKRYILKRCQDEKIYLDLSSIIFLSRRDLILVVRSRGYGHLSRRD
jgi:hypothetical protein